MATKNKATHSGTCQVCGRAQALPNGKIAKHGYTVEYHFFNGVCLGGRGFLPLEQDRSLADEIAAQLREQAKEATRKAKRVEAGKLRPERIETGFSMRDLRDRNGDRIPETIAFAAADKYQQERAVEGLRQRFLKDAKDATSYANGIIERAEATTGKKPLTPRVEEERLAVAAGVTIKLFGNVYTVERIETRECRGCGPYLNGQHLPHAIYKRPDGTAGAYPVRLIRQKQIMTEAK